MNYKKEIDVSELYHVYFLINQILENLDDDGLEGDDIYDYLSVAKNILTDFL